MVTRDFSGMDIVKVLGNAGNFAWVRTTGDYAIMKWTVPPDHDTEDRTVSVPLHDHVRTRTLHSIAEDAGMKDFNEFCRWIDRNRWLERFPFIYLQARSEHLIERYKSWLNK